MYRLIKRAQDVFNLYDDETLVLRSSSVSKGTITAAEWAVVSEVMLPGARVLTLVPIGLAAAAIELFGKTNVTYALLKALNRLPGEWDEAVEAGAGEGVGDDNSNDGGDDHDGGDGGGGASGSGDGGGGASGSGDGSTPPGGSDAGSESQGDTEGGGAEGSSVEDEDEDDDDGEAPRAKAAKLSLDPVPEKLEAELQAYSKYRTTPLNSARRGAACVEVTSGNDRSNVLRFLGYLSVHKGVQVKGLAHVFASPRLAPVVQQWVELLVTEQGLRYSTAGKYVLSLLCVARFTHEIVKKSGSAAASKLDGGQLDALAALHQQCVAEATKQDVFRKDTPVNWLSWEECQRARVHAERQCLREDAGEGVSLDTLHDVCLLTLLTYQPPDRVKMMRTLQLGVSLLRAGVDDYKLNVASPEAHKTAKTFGPTLTTMPRAVGTRIKAYVDAAKLEEGMYLFYPAGDASQPLAPSSWTKRVKQCFQTHAGVPLAPKELRASFVTFLKSNNHDNATLKAAATAMRHSSTMQRSSAYHKGQHDKTIEAAVRVAEAYASRFSAAA